MKKLKQIPYDAVFSRHAQGRARVRARIKLREMREFQIERIQRSGTEFQLVVYMLGKTLFNVILETPRIPLEQGMKTSLQYRQNIIYNLSKRCTVLVVHHSKRVVSVTRETTDHVASNNEPVTGEAVTGAFDEEITATCLDIPCSNVLAQSCPIMSL